MAASNKLIFLLVAIVLGFTSCQPSKRVHQERLLLQGIDTGLVKEIIAVEQQIQKADKIAITIYSDDAAASSFYNLGQSQSASSIATASSIDASSASGTGGYIVDDAGNILMPRLGLVFVDGLTKNGLQKLLQQKLDTFLKHPYADIRFLNKRVTILGEVSRPGIINMPEERLNIFDAIALSGDLTGFARNDDIVVVREENGKRSVGHLNIRNPAVYKSPFFYLQKDDLVYIEPIRKKPTGTDQTLVRNVSLAASLVSVLAILYSVYRNN